MKILHTSDWHLGRMIYGRSLLEDQEHFIQKENGAVILDDSGRKLFLNAWQERKQDVIKHPFLNEKIEWGMVPHAQAMLLARYLRGDLDEYPSFLWK